MITSQVRPAIKAHAGIELMNELPIAIMLNVLARFTLHDENFMQTAQNWSISKMFSLIKNFLFRGFSGMVQWFGH